MSTYRRIQGSRYHLVVHPRTGSIHALEEGARVTACGLESGPASTALGAWKVRGWMASLEDVGCGQCRYNLKARRRGAIQ